MSKFSKTAAVPGTTQHTPRATLAAVGLKVSQLQLLAPVHEQVHMAQKVVKHTPSQKLCDVRSSATSEALRRQKLCDGFLAILAGAHGLVEINDQHARAWRPRAVPGLRTARRGGAIGGAIGGAGHAGRLHPGEPGADGSGDERHLPIDQRFGQGYRHDYAAEFPVLDVDCRVPSAGCGFEW